MSYNKKFEISEDDTLDGPAMCQDRADRIHAKEREEKNATYTTVKLGTFLALKQLKLSK